MTSLLVFLVTLSLILHVPKPARSDLLMIYGWIVLTYLCYLAGPEIFMHSGDF